MQKLQEWLDDFMRGKIEVTSLSSSGQYAVHSMRRFLERSTIVWDIAITYAGRLIVRLGQIAEDHVNVLRGHWVTNHDVDVPKVVR